MHIVPRNTRVDLGGNPEIDQVPESADCRFKRSVHPAERVVSNAVCAVETDGYPENSGVLDPLCHGLIDEGAVGSQGNAQILAGGKLGKVKNITSPERFAAAQHQAALTGMMDVTREHPMPGPAGHTNAQPTQVAGLARHKFTRRAVRHFDPIVEAALDDEALQRDMGCVLKRYDRRIHRGQGDLSDFQVAWRPQIKTARFAVDYKLPGLIKFFQHVQRAVAAWRRVALHETVNVRSGEADATRGGIDCCDLNDLVIPIVAPVALEPHPFRGLPARWPVACILEASRKTALVTVAGTRAGLYDPGDRRPALVVDLTQRLTDRRPVDAAIARMNEFAAVPVRIEFEIFDVDLGDKRA